MFGRNRHRDGAVAAEKGPSLAKGPAMIVGSILLVAGLLGITANADFPKDTFADGTVNGDTLLGFEVNGWTNFLLIACGGLLLFGAAQHLLAKTMSLIVGLILGATAIMAVIDGNDALGLAAANNATKLALGIAAAVLVFNTLMPRVTRKRDREVAHRDVVDRQSERDRTVADRPATTAAPAGRFTRDRDRDHDHDRDHDPIHDAPERVGAGLGQDDRTAVRDRSADATTEHRRGGIF